MARHEGVKAARHKLIRFYEKDEWELYDLKEDPKELKSVYDQPEYAKIQGRMRRELDRLRKEYEVPTSVYQALK